MGVLFGDLSTAAPVTLICRASLCFSCFAGVFCGVFFSQCSSRPAVHLTPSRCRTSVNRLFYSSANSLSLNKTITLHLQTHTLNYSVHQLLKSPAIREPVEIARPSPLVSFGKGSRDESSYSVV